MIYAAVVEKINPLQCSLSAEARDILTRNNCAGLVVVLSKY